MDTNRLYQVTLLLILVSMIVGVGVLVLDKFGSAVYVDASGTQDNLILWTNNFTSTTDTTITASTLTGVNSSGGGSVTLICDSTTKWGCSSVKLGTASANGQAINLSYTYGVDSTTTTAANAARDEVSNVSTVWLGLIITIIILAMILFMVVRSFGSR